MSDLEDRIERLEAIEAVRALVSRYATTVDALPSAEVLGDLFTEDAVLENPARYEGRAAVVEYYGGVLSSLSFARHHAVNSTVTVEAPGRCRHQGYFFALMKRDGPELIVFGDYDDTVVRDADGTWRFERKGNFIRGSRTLADNDETKG